MTSTRAKNSGSKGGAATKTVLKKKSAGKKAPAKKYRATNTKGAPRKQSRGGSFAKSSKSKITAISKLPAKSSPKTKKSPPRSPLVDVILSALDDIKAVNITTLDVRGVTDIADTMIIASGNSDRHIRAIAERVVEFAKKAGFRPMGVEGERDSEWVLVDLTDVIVHVMLPRVREFYRLESLWDVTAARREAAGQ